MWCLLFMICLGDWRYDGFVAELDHRSQAIPPPAAPVPTPRPPEPSEVRVRSDPPARPKLWRLADSTGQVWEHPDPDWLKRWVGLENDRIRRGREAAARSSPPARPLSPLLVAPCPPAR
ncbi:MAG: hypothetical protein AB7I30_16290 [Isosphaeraceae bacterium]